MCLIFFFVWISSFPISLINESVLFPSCVPIIMVKKLFAELFMYDMKLEGGTRQGYSGKKDKYHIYSYESKSILVLRLRLESRGKTIL